MNSKLTERFDAQIVICSAIGITATIAAPQQEAEAVDYVYYQPNGGAGWVVPATTPGLYINVETQVTSESPGSVPAWDLNPYSNFQLAWSRNGNSNGYMYYPGVTSGIAIGNLEIGTTVGNSAAFVSNLVSNSPLGSGAGQFKLNSPNYVGFYFTGADNGLHYGWLRVDVGAAATIRTIMEVGYSTVIGQSVQVGAVPEPSTVIMGLLASGATGVIAWRRKRQPA